MFELIADKMIRILEEPCYGLDSGSLNRLRELRGAAAYTVDNLPDAMIMADTEGRETTVYDTPPVKRPQVIDPFPVLLNGRLSAFRPVLVLPSARGEGRAGLWNSLAQICRLFSVGDYREGEDGIISHCFGMNQYRFRRMEEFDRLEILVRREYPIKNEIFNDAATWHLMELLGEGEPYVPDIASRSVCRQFKETQGFERLVGMYFSGNPEITAELSKSLRC